MHPSCIPRISFTTYVTLVRFRSTNTTTTTTITSSTALSPPLFAQCSCSHRFSSPPFALLSTPPPSSSSTMCSSSIPIVTHSRALCECHHVTCLTINKLHRLSSLAYPSCRTVRSSVRSSFTMPYGAQRMRVGDACSLCAQITHPSVVLHVTCVPHLIRRGGQRKLVFNFVVAHLRCRRRR